MVENVRNVREHQGTGDAHTHGQSLLGGRDAEVAEKLAPLWMRRVVGWLTSQSRAARWLTDLGFVLVFSAFHVFDLAITPRSSEPFWWWPLLLSVPATGLLMLRRTRPWIPLLVLLTVTTTLTLLQLSVGVLNQAILVAVYSVCVRGDLIASLLATVLAMVYPVAEVLQMSLGYGILNIFGAIVNLVMIVGWGRAMRVGRQRAAKLEQALTLLDEARDQLAADAAVIERARIAREFHDIVSHNLSVVALRAGVARALVDRDPEHARQTLHELEHTSRGALAEMRNLLSALRVNADEQIDGPVDWQPAPRLDRLDALIDSVQGGGVTWRLERRGSVRELGPGVEMTAYRIVQEAVTNVVKHAGFGRASVLLDYGADSLTIEVTNDVDADGPRRAGAVSKDADDSSIVGTSHTSGHGLIGLQERVGLLGGTLTAHPKPGGFHLGAVLPCAENSDPA